MKPPPGKVLLVMGVAGSGKTTIATAVSRRLGWQFIEADDFHTPTNRAKMQQGIALTDEDRAPWLKRIHGELLRLTGNGENVVLACSALKHEYREELSAGVNLDVVYLKAAPAVLAERLRHRQGHYAGESLLASQLETLEEPSATDVFDMEPPIDEVVEEILRRKGLTTPRIAG